MAQIAHLEYSDGITGTNSFSEIGELDVSEMSEVYEYSHEIYSPIDLNIGQVQGARVHKPLTIKKPVDTASAPLLQAACIGQTLEQFVLHFFRVSTDGTLEEYWTITMENVKVAAYRPILPNVKDESLLNVPVMEEVEFLYQQITWSHSEGFEYLDEWVAPPS